MTSPAGPDPGDSLRLEQRRAAEHAVMRVLASADSIEAAAPLLLEAVCRCGDWDLGELWVVDARAGVLRLTEFWRGDPSSVSEFIEVSRAMTFPPGVGLPGRVWSSRAPAWVEDVVRDSNFPRAQYAARAGLHAACGFPIRNRDEVIGVMVFYSPKLRQPDLDLLNSLEVVGGQIGHFMERVRSQQALAESEARWHRIFSGAPIGVFHSTPAGQLIDANPAMASMLRYESPEELVRAVNQASMAEVLYVDPGRRSEIVGKLEEHPGCWVRTETRFRCKDGTVIAAELEIKQFETGRGEPLVIEGFLADVTERRLVERDLRESEATFRKLFEDSSDAILLIDSTGVFVECNQAALDLLKMTREAFLLLPPARISPEFQPGGRRSSEAAPEMMALAYGKGLHRFDWTCVDSEGGEFIVEVSLMPVAVKGQTMLHTTWRDITERKRIERELQESEERFRFALQAAPLTVFLQDSELRYVWIHNVQVGLGPENIVGRKDEDIVGPEQATSLTALKRRALDSGVRTRAELCATVAGKTFWQDIHIEPRRDGAGNVVGAYGASWDITERKRIEGELQAALEKVRELTLHDPLTGIANRRHFEQCLAVELSSALRSDRALSLAMFDIDHFKAVNDALGHGTGDAVLKSIAATLAKAIRPEDVLARYGGDEFVLILRDTNSADAMLLVERLRAEIERMAQADPDATLRVTMSAGVASLTDCREPTRDQLVGTADARLYHAKEAGRNRVEGPASNQESAAGPGASSRST